MLFVEELNRAFDKDLDNLYKLFRYSYGVDLLQRIGETYLAEQFSGRKWNDEEKDREFLSYMLQTLGILKLEDIKIIFNNGVYEKTHKINQEQQISDTIKIENLSFRQFQFSINNIICSDNIIIERVEKGVSSVFIDYSIKIDDKFKSVEDYDLYEYIIFDTNYKTFEYRVNLNVVNNLELKNINKLEMKFGFLQYQLEVPFEKEQPIEVKIDNEFVNVEYENEKVYIRKNLKLLRENSKNKTDNKRYKSEVLLYYKDRVYDINIII